jgi:hypothetical protein
VWHHTFFEGLFLRAKIIFATCRTFREIMSSRYTFPLDRLLGAKTANNGKNAIRPCDHHKKDAARSNDWGYVTALMGSSDSSPML